MPRSAGSLVADGCKIEEGAVIENSIIGLRCLIGRNVTIRNSILMGNDFYEAPDEIAAGKSNGRPPLGVGCGTHIEGAIIDKNCRIGCHVRIVNAQGRGLDRRNPLRHDPRRHRGDSQGRHAAGQLVDVETSPSPSGRGSG